MAHELHCGRDPIWLFFRWVGSTTNYCRWGLLTTSELRWSCNGTFWTLQGRCGPHLFGPLLCRCTGDWLEKPKTLGHQTWVLRFLTTLVRILAPTLVGIFVGIVGNDLCSFFWWLFWRIRFYQWDSSPWKTTIWKIFYYFFQPPWANLSLYRGFTWRHIHIGFNY